MFFVSVLVLIIFPLLRPAVITICLVSSVFIFNDFVNPLYFLPGSGHETVQLTLFHLPVNSSEIGRSYSWTR